MPDSYVMAGLVKDYQTAKKTLAWFAEYDNEEHTRQVVAKVSVVAGATPGADEAMATLKKVVSSVEDQLRAAAIAHAQAIVDGFKSAMMAELSTAS